MTLELLVYLWLIFYAWSLFRFHELAKDIKYNKGGILAATVSYLKMLKMDQIRKNHLEEEVRAQALQNRKLLNKIQVSRKFTCLGGKTAGQ